MMYIFWEETERFPHVIGDFVWTAFDYIGEAGGGAISFDGRPRFGAPYPYHLYGCGDFDICGFKRPQSYYRDLLWGTRSAPFIAVLDPQHYGKPIAFTPWGWEPVLDTWTFPGQEGRQTRVDVYSTDDEVELLINGEPAGRKPAGAASQNKASFDVTYQPGVIEAVGYREGAGSKPKETGRARLVTAGKPAALRLTPDRSTIQAGGGDLAYVTIEVQDENGVLVKHGEPLISVEVSGAGVLIAIGSGNPLSEEPYTGGQHKAYHGRLLAIIRSARQAGLVTVTATLEEQLLARIELQAI
jgi:beta-galactosidase